MHSRIVSESGGLQPSSTAWCARDVPLQAHSSAVSSTAGHAYRRGGACRRHPRAAAAHCPAATRKPTPIQMIRGCDLGDSQPPHAKQRKAFTWTPTSAAAPSNSSSSRGQTAQWEVEESITKERRSCAALRRGGQRRGCGLTLVVGERRLDALHGCRLVVHGAANSWNERVAKGGLCGAGCRGAWELLVDQGTQCGSVQGRGVPWELLVMSTSSLGFHAQGPVSWMRRGCLQAGVSTMRC